MNERMSVSSLHESHEYHLYFVSAEPIVQEAMKYIPAGAVFIYCQVGDRSYWKDPNNEFRKNLKITAVPTLLKYGAPKQLVEVECSQADLVQKFFAED
uniref:Thioredoxin domain-containing protein 17 n=1 Tax=Ornithorhynchus anatinus TaxID=9258 RepID=A0A6I8N0E6_ORNAN